MENADFALSAAFTEYVPIFYAPPVAEADEFVLPDAPEEGPETVAVIPMVEMTPVAEATVPTVYFQEYHNGWGMFLLDDGDPLVDDTRVSDWLYRTESGAFLTLDEWSALGLVA